MTTTSEGASSAPSERGGSESGRRDGEASVSRETEQPPPPPEAAVALFGDRLDRVVRYVELLAGPGVVRGLIGPREIPRLWDRHIMNCAVVADLVPADATVDDVGSGAGLPGIVLALARPDLRIALVEPLLRRTVFLEELVSELALDRVAVVRARAEDRVPAHAGVDVVTARAVAPLARLAGWCLPLLNPGGVLLALKGASAAAELAAAQAALRKAGGDQGEVLVVGGQLVDPPTTVVRITRMTRSVARSTQARRRKR